MDFDVRELSNAVMIDSLHTIIRREHLKLQMDKTTGLLAKIQSKVSTAERSSRGIESARVVAIDTDVTKDSASHSPKRMSSFDRENQIERLANSLSRPCGSLSTNSNNNGFDISHSQALLKGKTYNELDSYRPVFWCNKSQSPVTSDIKVKSNVRFGQYSPVNPANQVSSQPFLGIGEYDIKKKQLLQSQKKDYIDYLSQAKQKKNMSHLPKSAPFSCEEAFKTVLEANCSEPKKLNCKSTNCQEEDKINLVPFIDGIESCVLDEDKQKETNRLKQEFYRLELNKQIEEKKKLNEELKYKERMEDEAIERAQRDQEEKLQKEFEKEAEKRTLAQLQKQLAQEKLKNELMKKQRELAAAERVSRQVLKHVRSRHVSSEDYDNDKDVPCSVMNNSNDFDNVPLPTTRVRVPRKIDYRDVSCNTDTFNNPCMNQNISLPIARHHTERAHVSFASDPPPRKNVHNPAALLPVTKSVITDAPLTLALAGLDDDNGTCEAIEPTEAAYGNQTSNEALVERTDHELLTDKHLLSNLGDMRKRLNVAHELLKKQVRKSQ